MRRTPLKQEAQQARRPAASAQQRHMLVTALSVEHSTSPLQPTNKGKETKRVEPKPSGTSPLFFPFHSRNLL
jgi:hypothetical protein